MKVAISSYSVEGHRTITADVSETNPLIAGGKYEIRSGGADFYYIGRIEDDLTAYGPPYMAAHNCGVFTVLSPDVVTCKYSRGDVVNGILVIDSEEKMHILEDGDFILGYLGTEEPEPVSA